MRLMEIYISRGGDRVGPFSLEEINHQLATGMLSPSDLGWSETSPGWKPLVSFVGVIAPGGASSTAAPISLATPVTFGLPDYAGFWIRALAFVIDAIILSIFALVIQLALKRGDIENGPGFLVIALQFALFFLYGPVLWASSMHATAGQRICRIKVIPALRGKMTFQRGLVRSLAMILSGLILGIGFIMAGLTERKRALHDKIADTFVVKDS